MTSTVNARRSLLLHPGGADARAWAPNLGSLAAHFHVYTPERCGHARTPDVDGPITCEVMAQDTIAFLEQLVGGPAHLVGHSAGANVALLVAVRRRDLARRIVLITGVFHRDGWIPEVIDPDRELHESLARGYAHSRPTALITSPSCPLSAPHPAGPPTHQHRDL